ncbi:unnamed protein product [Rotaria socialis]|uniref:Serine/arginine-rich splicing factor 2 n=2 Tax=Rotaria socialis TaxID=392032 RepID=A0A817SHD0_9BILA|nr:unnamed protein product [Rotaria socialis]CAF3298249.1 unnamed protein product [Rotaria socialis]CAF3625816.1 unnamed protein product [Rotaria socialis]CAF3672856.1 unnamed protein product [Rotaria socialis]CAF3748909.1 unnamed protein product [Rotaria socialis]
MSSRSRNTDDRREVSPKVDVMYSLKVDNLTYRTRVEDLRRCFEKFGSIGDIYIPRDQFSRSSRGYAFVRFSKKRDAQDALERMDGTDLDGREIRVQFARYGRASATDSREKVRHRRTRSRSRSPRRSKHRSRSNSRHRRSRSRSSRRSRSKSASPSKRSNRNENGERDQRQEKK